VTADHRIFPGDPEYPELLGHISRPPKCLNVLGRMTRSDALAVAVVGARNPTPYGCHMARLIAGGLAASGVTVVSGLARGIDTEAHRAALEKNGRTIAVLGCGLDIEYPKGSGELKKLIIAKGALISEFEEGTPPLPRNFPSRNRVISGLSLAVVVIQASVKSGSLITARWALDQGREVMAVPGRVDDPLSAGPIALLKDGAVPVCHSGDILQTLGMENLIPALPGSGVDMPDPDPLMNVLKKGPRLPEELATVTGLPLPGILAELSRLEIEGLVIRDSGGQFALK
jgi:DNA processing protein